MKTYLLIESRDSFESRDVVHFGQIARDLAAAGHVVTMLLVQNGVLAARRGARDRDLATLSASGVTVLADEFSLRERAIGLDQLACGVAATGLEIVIDQMAGGAKTLWH